MVGIAPGLFEVDSEGVWLLGGRRKTDGRIVFPLPHGPEAAAFEPVRLSRTGTLWSWTIQRFRPKTPPYAGPEAFAPFAVGYVELPGEIIVESRLVVDDFSVLRLGLPMEATIESLSSGADWTEVATYAFRPAREEVLQ